MGGQAGNAQLFSILSQYGNGGGGGGTPGSRNGNGPGTHEERAKYLQQLFQQNFESGMFGQPNAPKQKNPVYNYGGGSSLGFGGMGNGGGKKNNPVAPLPAQSFNWQFPQYTQGWAFTPPAPTPYNNPPPFNPDTYLKKKK